MSFFRNILGGVGLASPRDPNPADRAQEYLNRIPGYGQSYLSPYIARGNAAENESRNIYNQQYQQYANMPDLYRSQNPTYNEFPDEYGSMAKDPTAFVERLMAGYEPSRGYKFREGRALGTAANTAAAGGFAGTQEDELRRAELVKNLLGEDMQQYLSNILGVQGAGLAGQERRITGRERGQERQLLGQERALQNMGMSQEGAAQRGFDAAKAFADLLAGNAAQQGNVAYAGQNAANASRNVIRGNRLNLLGNVAGFIGGGGFNRGVNPGGFFPGY